MPALLAGVPALAGVVPVPIGFVAFVLVPMRGRIAIRLGALGVLFLLHGRWPELEAVLVVEANVDSPARDARRAVAHFDVVETCVEVQDRLPAVVEARQGPTIHDEVTVRFDWTWINLTSPVSGEPST